MWGEFGGPKGEREALLTRSVNKLGTLHRYMRGPLMAVTRRGLLADRAKEKQYQDEAIVRHPLLQVRPFEPISRGTSC